MSHPTDLRYTNDHEWLRAEGGKATVGITHFAVEQLGDITLIELPAVGAAVTKGTRFGTVESVKSVSDLYAPISGTVVAVNGALKDRPELVNEGPYADGWMITIEPTNAGEVEELLTAAAYGELLASQA
ncbi:MAG: glycine cleavage system protein GcvH [Deltaproteobacteria bacterium]|nr:glycine cleavage system protein GcvH [Deltaproteobacteria bacterium]